MNPSEAHAAGTVIDERYELVEQLADRGLGTTWSARDAKFKNRHVAVKFLRALGAGVVSPPDDLARHLKALRALRHPNLLATVNQGVWQFQPYIVQDLFTGASLGAGLDQARETGQLLPIELLSGLFDRICAGIDAGHQTAPQPVLHLGLNPGCVLIHRVPGQDFDVRVIDQGLAPWADPPRGAPVRSARGLHNPAPEQFTAGMAPGPFTDVFALGGLLREMLATPASLGETLSPAGMHRRRDDVPAAVWDVIDQATRPAPTERFASVSALRAASREAWAQPVTPRASAVPRAVAPSSAPASALAVSAQGGQGTPPDLFKTAFLPGSSPGDANPSAPAGRSFGPMPSLPVVSPGDPMDLGSTMSLASAVRGGNPWDLSSYDGSPSSDPFSGADAFYSELDARFPAPSPDPNDLAATLTTAGRGDPDDLAATVLDRRIRPMDVIRPSSSPGGAPPVGPPATHPPASARYTPAPAPVPRTPAPAPRPAIVPVVAPVPERTPGGGGPWRTVLAVVGLILGMALIAGLVLGFYHFTHA